MSGSVGSPGANPYTISANGNGGDGSDPNANLAAFGQAAASPGWLGIPQSTWQNIEALGAGINSALNQRTSGGFLANGTNPLGAVGPGLQSAMQYGLQNQQVQSEVAQRAAATQGQQLQNQLTAMSLPFMRARTQAQLDWLQGGAGAPSMPMSPAGAPPTTPSPTGGSIIDPSARGSIVNFAVQGTNIPAPLASSLIETESGWDPTAVSKTGALGLTQVEPTTAQQPGYGLPSIDPAYITGPQNAPNNARFGMLYLNAIGAKNGLKTPADWTDPQNSDKVAAALRSYHGDQNDQYYPARVMGRAGMMGPQAARTMGGYPSNAAQPLPPMMMMAAAAGQNGGQEAGAPVMQPNGTPTLGPDGQPLVLPPVGASGGGQPPQAGASAPSQAYAPPPGLPSPQQLWQLSQHAQAQADYFARGAMLGMPGADLQSQEWQERAQQYNQAALAGIQAGSEAAAKLPFMRQVMRPGSIQTDAMGNQISAAPVLTQEIDPRTGAQYRVFLDPRTGQPIASGAPGGTPPMTSLGPQAEEQLKAAGGIPGEQIDADNKMINEEQEHVIGNVLPTQNQLLQLRDQITGANTGALGQFRATMKNYLQTFAPGVADSIGADATPAQIFNKIALMSAGKQERGDLGSRGGFKAIEMYANANPNLDMQPDANRHMVNALLIMQQAEADYAAGATNHFQQARNAYQQNPTGTVYSPVTDYDAKFGRMFTPQMYKTAIDAINGSSGWATGLSRQQQRIVVGILQRADPTATISIGGSLVPVTAAKNIYDPTQVP